METRAVDSGLGIDEDARNVLSDPATYRSAELECDAVMKGGITSGVLYPLAICELAKKYRLRSIGGTSAGAIAAAAAAAAEYGRTSNAPTAGFQGLAQVPEWSIKPGNLVGVFAPAPSTKSLHSLLLAAIAKPAKPMSVLLNVVRNAFAAKGRFLWVALLPIVVGVVLLWVMHWGTRWDWLRGLGFFVAALGLIGGLLGLRMAKQPKIARCVPVAERQRLDAQWKHDGSSRRRKVLLSAIVAAASVALIVFTLVDASLESRVIGSAFAFFVVVIGGIVGAAIATLLAAGHSLSGNLFGIVSGSNAEESSLSDWLTGLINELAGLDPQAAPLTFGQLRQGPDGSPDRGGDEHGEPFVNLEMQTTCVTLGVPFRMPDAFGELYFYDPDDFAKYFPKRVVDFLNSYVDPTPRPPSKQAEYDKVVAIGARQGLKPLPPSDGLPVIVATRMSLSFPVLLSAVRLYAIDYACADAANGSYVMDECWFSDGGVTSNFPITYFDSMLPSRPTFGITLRGFQPAHPQSNTDQSDNVWMPRKNDQGIMDWWTKLAPAVGLGSLVGFFSLILNTMQNWVDNQQSHVSGFRDRIVTIYHNKEEGGMNLNMPEETLIKLSERGRAAGALLSLYYTTEEPGRTVSWENHRWIRARNTLAQLEGEFVKMSTAYPQHYEALVNRDKDQLPSYKWNNETQRSTAIQMFEGTPDVKGMVPLGVELEQQIEAKETDSLRNGSPTPMPSLVSRPGQS